RGEFGKAASVLDQALRSLRSHLLWIQIARSEHGGADPQRDGVKGTIFGADDHVAMDITSTNSVTSHHQQHTLGVDVDCITTSASTVAKEILHSVPVPQFRPGQLSANEVHVPSFDMYNKAFLLSPQDLQVERYSDCVQVDNWVSVVLMYNTALVHYNLGVAQRMCAFDLNRSLKFFEIADEMIGMMEVGAHFDILLLKAATANNMGHIHCCLHASANAKAYYQVLEGVLQVLQWMPQLEEDDYCLFFMNTGIHVDSLKAAPAA
ncbi:MAG: hypothetical protein SGILL_006121, partial [Bacillariaceae sp.]